MDLLNDCFQVTCHQILFITLKSIGVLLSAYTTTQSLSTRTTGQMVDTTSASTTVSSIALHTIFVVM